MKRILLFIGALNMYLLLQAQVLPTGFNNLVPATNDPDFWVEPVGAAFSKDGKQLFIWEKRGKVFVSNRVESGPNMGRHDTQLQPVIDISDEVGNWSDMGLLGFALDPGYSSTSGGHIYLFYVVDRHHLLTGGLAANGYDPAQNNYFSATIGRITRYTTSIVGGNLVADPLSREILLGETITTGVPILHKSHSIGTLAFAADGTLLATTGDGASYDDTDIGEITNDDPAVHTNTYYADALADGIITANEDVGAFRSQMLSSLSGKLLRLDPESGDGISSNPFFDNNAPRSAKSRIWALGFRNPFRMSVKPGAGSPLPIAGDIGEVFVGDVGWGQAEELNIVTAPGQNFGWPIYEGSAPSADPGNSYWGYDQQIENKDEIPGGSCHRAMFFHELLVQDNAAKISDIYTPSESACGGGQFYGSGNRFIHARPALEWARTPGKVFVPRFNEQGEAIWPIIGSPESNVTANSTFVGNCSTGGIWLTGGTNPSFPPEYKNTFLVSDFGGRWVRRIGIDFSDVVTSVDDFFINPPDESEGAVVCMAENPLDGSIVYVTVGGADLTQQYGSSTAVKKIVFGGNIPPVANITADNYFSASSSLTVNFNGSESYDPDGEPDNTVSSYAWDFGDPDSGLVDNFSDLENPTHTFTTTPGVPKKYIVTLTVTDAEEYPSEEKKFIISLNNTPPVVNIISPIDGDKYTVGGDTTYVLQANVTDDPTQTLTYAWQASFIHNTHSHPEAIDTAQQTTAVIGRSGCNGDEYSWLIQLRVTDDAGLSTIDSSQIFPNCTTALPLILRSFSVTQKTSVNLVKWTTEFESNIEYFEVERSYDGVNFYPINRQEARNTPGTSHYNFADNDLSPGIIYYRLKMVEQGSVIRYSVTVRTSTEGENIALKIVPNPVVDNFSVMYKSARDEVVTIQIKDITGRILHTLKESVNRGQNVIYLQNLPTWPAGVYFLSLQNKEEIKQIKFIKSANN